MNLEQLRAVRMIEQKGSFSKAAHELFITQPALSMQIRSLEEEIGEPIFKKSGRKKIITSTGELVLEHATAILGELDALSHALHELKGLDSGAVSIAASDTVTRYLLIHVIQLFSERFPHIRIKISNKITTEIVSMLQDGKTDMGIVTLPLVMKGFEMETLFAYRYVAVTAPQKGILTKKTITLRELSKHHLLLLERGTRTREALESQLNMSNISQDQIMDLGSVDVQKDLAKIGAGVAIVPDFSITEEHKTDALDVALIKDLPVHEIGMVCRSGKRPSATAAFISFLKANVLGRNNPVKT